MLAGDSALFELDVAIEVGVGLSVGEKIVFALDLLFDILHVTFCYESSASKVAPLE